MGDPRAERSRTILAAIAALLAAAPLAAQLDRLTGWRRDLDLHELRYRIERGRTFLTRDHRPEKILGTNGVSLLARQLALRADSVVVWLDPNAAFALVRKKNRAAPRPFYTDRPPGFESGDYRAVLGIYAEGDVHFQFRDQVIRAERLYFDTRTERGTVIRAYVSTALVRKGRPAVPLHVRADELRLRGRELHGENLTVTTCGYARPHYDIRARRLDLLPAGDHDRSIAVHGATVNIHRLPILYLPYLWGRASLLERFPQVSGGADRRFGTYVYTTWEDEVRFRGRDGRERRWGKVRVHLDNRTRRGPAQGLDIVYGTDDYHGFVTGYYTRDRSTDLARRLNFKPPDRDRGRLRGWHRQWLPGELQLDVEAAWLRDRNFLYEYFEHEARAEKPQENYVRLKRDWHNWTAQLLYRPRLNDFFTRVEYLPRLSANGFSQPLVPGGLLGTNLYLDLDADAAQGRLRIDDELKRTSPSIRDRSARRADVRASLELPLRLGPLHVNPFLTGQYTAWSETLFDRRPDDRHVWTAGVRLHTEFWKTYEKALFGMDLRHLVMPQVLYTNTYSVSLTPDRIIPLDEKDLVNKFEAITVRLQQKLQVKPGRDVLDILEAGAEMVFYPQEDRDNHGRAEGPLFLDLKAGVAPLFLLADALIDWDEDDAVLLNTGLQAAVAKIPGLPRSNAYLFAGHRFAKRLASVATTGLFANLGEKWSFAGLYQYDYRADHPLDQRYVLTRAFHRFRLEVEFFDDGGTGDHGFKVQFAPVEFFGDLVRLRRRYATGQFLGDY